MNIAKSTYNYDYFSAGITSRKTSGAQKNHVNYYPFGLKHSGYNNAMNGGNSVAQKFKYNGVELNESLNLNLYEMELRLYDPTIARWNGIDVVDHYEYSPYQAFDNNPIFWTDPSGADSEERSQSRNVTIKPSIAEEMRIKSLGYDAYSKDNNECCGKLFTKIMGSLKAALGFNTIKEEEELIEDGDFQAALDMAEKQKEGSEKLGEFSKQLYRQVTAFDPFMQAGTARLLMAFDSGQGVNSFYRDFNFLFEEDNGPVSDGIFGLIGLLTAGTGSGGVPKSSYWSNGRVFYSGSGSKAEAIAFAKEKGVPLVVDMWYGKAALTISKLSKNKTFQHYLWSVPSAIYAKTARGTVHTFLRGPLRPNNIWGQTEKPILDFFGTGVLFK